MLIFPWPRFSTVWAGASPLLLMRLTRYEVKSEIFRGSLVPVDECLFSYLVSAQTPPPSCGPLPPPPRHDSPPVPTRRGTILRLQPQAPNPRDSEAWLRLAPAWLDNSPPPRMAPCGTIKRNDGQACRGSRHGAPLSNSSSRASPSVGLRILGCGARLGTRAWVAISTHRQALFSCPATDWLSTGIRHSFRTPE